MSTFSIASFTLPSLTPILFPLCTPTNWLRRWRSPTPTRLNWRRRTVVATAPSTPTTYPHITRCSIMEMESSESDSNIWSAKRWSIIIADKLWCNNLPLWIHWIKKHKRFVRLLKIILQFPKRQRHHPFYVNGFKNLRISLLSLFINLNVNSTSLHYKRQDIIIPVVAKGVHRRKFSPRVAPDFHKEAAVLIPQEQVGGAGQRRDILEMDALGPDKKPHRMMRHVLPHPQEGALHPRHATGRRVHARDRCPYGHGRRGANDCIRSNGCRRHRLDHHSEFGFCKGKKTRGLVQVNECFRVLSTLIDSYRLLYLPPPCDPPSVLWVSFVWNIKN